MRRYYVHEDADDGVEILAPDAPWMCAICGEWEHNTDGCDGAVCYFCKTVRGSWQCECGLVNQDTEDCQECGSHKEDA